MARRPTGAPKSVPKVDRELIAGTAAHYEDPVYYDRTYARRSEDVAFYVARAEELVASKSARGKRAAKPATILEYGCGSGRITIPMARAGAHVLGVDQSAPMLDKLGDRLATESADVQARVRKRQGDMRALKVAERFDLVICPFNTFLHLYERTDVEQFLARVREHLAPAGDFVFDVSMPDPEELSRKPERMYRTRPFVYPGVGRVRYGEYFDYDGLRQILFVSSEFEPVDGGDRFMRPLTHRQFYPQELEALLHYNGFEIVEWVGDFDGKATHESHHLAVTARPRAQRSRRVGASAG
ncbi:MAG: class I SAM-dependent methyltransferase [Polyangiaceae bacterium]|nr:class I SAM-dependent methyltransferase [Polyangiaceae bacterium]